MFILLQVKDTIRIPPEDAHLLQQDPLHLIRVQINQKYANKVIPDIGLCALVHSILSYDDPTLFPSDPGPYVRCTFRLVVFQPQEGEIIKATIESCTPTSIILSVGFFTHIVVEASSLATNSSWDEHEKVWVWDSDGAKYHYDLGMPVRLRVLRTTFNSALNPDQPQVALGSATMSTTTATTTTTTTTNATTNLLENLPPKSLKHGYTRPPQPPSQQLTRAQIAAGQAPQEEKTHTYNPPFMVYGSMLDHGLGPIEWWD